MCYIFNRQSSSPVNGSTRPFSTGARTRTPRTSHAELQHPDFQQLLVRHAHLHLGARVVAEFDTLRGWDFLGTS